jgi:transposase
MAEPMSCCALPGSYCARIDALFNHDGVHVIDVRWRSDRLWLTLETDPVAVGCPGCGVLAGRHGRRVRRLHDIPAFGAPVELTWRVRRFRCQESLCLRNDVVQTNASPASGRRVGNDGTWPSTPS